MTEEAVGVIPSGKHRGKRLADVSNDILVAMQASWIDSRRLRASPFFSEIQSEVVRRGLLVLNDDRPKKGTEASLKLKARHSVKQWLDSKYGGEIPQETLAAAKALFGS